jgi:phosphoglycerol transferase MdoB-like AlkP superfamily enzyme
LDNTVISFTADHYPYGLEEEEISAFLGHEVDSDFELYENNLVIWNSRMTTPVKVDKLCSHLDIVPTLCNLFNLPYDSRLFFGSDILSDAAPLVMFSNQSFITDKLMYNTRTGKKDFLTNENVGDDYTKNIINIVKNKFSASRSLMANDFYKALPKLEGFK